MGGKSQRSTPGLGDQFVETIGRTYRGLMWGLRRVLLVFGGVAAIFVRK